MAEMVQLAVAGDITEAEEIQTILTEAGITSRLEPAVDHHPREVDDAPTKVLVAESELEAAQEAILALTEPDELGRDA